MSSDKIRAAMAGRPLQALPLIALALFGAGCAAKRANVLLVSIDTLRADYLADAPYLSHLADEGRSFSAMYSSSNWTLPSHVSLFTSLPYVEHDLPPAGSSGTHAGIRLADSRPTLASVLRAAGYATGATTEGGWVRPEFGLDRGFERFEIAKPVSAGGKAVFDEHLAAVRRFLGGRGERPFFLFVHTYWVHDYFVNTPDFHDLVTASDDPYVALGNLLKDVEPSQRDAVPSGFVKRLYRAGVRRADLFLEDLVTAVLEESGGAPLLVVVTSDHGESFGERPGAWGHGHSLEQELIRVPLVAWSNAGARPRGRIDVPASTIDVAPSILAWLGLDVPEGFRGMADRFLTATPSSSLVLARHHAGSGQDPSQGKTGQALISGPWKYERADSFDGRRLEEHCFDLSADPAARVDVMADSRSECVRFRDAFERLRAVDPGHAYEPSSELSEPDPEMKRQLRALGYLD